MIAQLLKALVRLKKKRSSEAEEGSGHMGAESTVRKGGRDSEKPSR